MIIGELTALLTAILWAVSSYFFASATVKVGSVNVNFARLVIAMILFVLTIFIFQIPLNISSYQFWMLVLSGIAGLVIGDSLFFKSLEFLSARISILVTSFSPAISAILAFIFLSEKLSLLDIFGMAIALTGIVLVVLRKEENTGPAKSKKGIRIGVLLAFLYTLGQSTGLIFLVAGFKESEINSIVATAIRILPAVVLLFFYILYKEKSFKPFSLFRNEKRAYKDIIIAAVLSAYIGMVLMFIAVTQTNIAVASTIIASIPVIQLFISHYFFKEKLTWRSVAGAFMTVAGMAILFLQ